MRVRFAKTKQTTDKGGIFPIDHRLTALASGCRVKSPIGPGAPFGPVVCVLVLFFFFFTFPHNVALFATC
jgi:hypothetical protein